MKQEKIEIRDALIEDAPLVAWTVLTALDMTADELPTVIDSCRATDTLYSWTNARILCVDGVAAGCLISYLGERYIPLRDYTWQGLWDDFDPAYLTDLEPEAVPGDYYLDSMALLPEYRGRDLAKRLLLDGIERGKALGCADATLIVSVDKPHLREYYASLGFVQFGEMDFFGHHYHRMRYKF